MSLWHKGVGVSNIIIQPTRAQPQGSSTNESGLACLVAEQVSAWVLTLNLGLEVGQQLLGVAVSRLLTGPQFTKAVSRFSLKTLLYGTKNGRIMALINRHSHDLACHDPIHDTDCQI